MRPESIKKKEDEFFKDLTNSAGVKYKLTATTDIGGGIKIYSIRPDFNTYYYKTKTVKKSICLHFTVGYIKSDVASLSTKDNCVSVSYVVDRSGRIYEMFPDSEWSYHLGSSAIGGNGVMSKQSIGIEISNYGPLKLSGENLVDAYGNIYCKVSEEEFYSKQNYRGYDYYASMTDSQIAAVSALIKYLGRVHDIPMNFKGDDAPFASNAEATSFRGVFYHTNVRKDKFDWPFTPSLKAVIAKCSNELPQKEEVAADVTAASSDVSKVDAVAPELDVAEVPQVEEPKVEEKTVEEKPVIEEKLAETAVPKEPERKPQVKKPAPSSSKKATSLLDIVLSLLAQLLGGKKK